MRAKEYAEQYKSEPSDKALLKVAFDMLMEIKQLAEQRKIKSDEGLFAILNEIENKWRAFVRIVDNPCLRTDGFEQLVMEQFPFVYPMWLNYRKGTNR